MEGQPPGVLRTGPGRKAGAVIVIGYFYSGTALFRKTIPTPRDSAWLDAPGLVHAMYRLRTLWEALDGQTEATSKASAVTRTGIRSLLQSMLVSRLARDGAKGWLATTSPTSPEALEFFAEIYDEARFVCLHRGFDDFATAVMAAQQWELAPSGSGLDNALMQYPWNPAAALAQYWVGHTTALLDFQRAHPDRCLRMHYAHLAERPEEVLTQFRALTGWEVRSAANRDGGGSSSPQAADAMSVPREKIPGELLGRVDHLMGELGYGTSGR